MCKSCFHPQYCQDCIAERGVYVEKPPRSKQVSPKRERATRVVVSGDVLYMQGRPYQLKRNIENELLKDGEELYVLTKDKKYCFRLKKHWGKVVLLRMQKRVIFSKKKPTPEINNKNLIGKINTQFYLDLANSRD